MTDDLPKEPKPLDFELEAAQRAGLVSRDDGLVSLTALGWRVVQE